uniref:NADH-ubiquinone oxidoreductase chain 2 n=1 Tax=Sminthurus viridis TaxID=109609 RepID=B2BS86_SMIVR|nr:NADH dehydrogenase subunit 2 [Sminthurus viridis]ABS82042.1 NADH dehydrogenase subunit 2 [Sminthurus viridis]
MFLKYSNSLFYFVLFLTPFVVISSESWVLMWLAMEVNLMMFIPLLMNKINSDSTSSAIKYFIIQAGASVVLIMSFMIFSKFNILNSIYINNEMIVISMAMKSGIPPLQFWLPQVMETMEFYDIIVLLTWQKISPMFIMSFYITNLLIVVILAGAIIGTLGGLNQNSMKKILAYSSMSHSSWIIMTLFMNMKMWFIYFVMYSIMVLMVVSICVSFNLNNLSNLESINISEKTKVLITMNLLSLGGLPPFIGFMMKFMIINYVVQTMILKMMLLIMIMMSLFSLFYYMKVSYGFMFKNSLVFKFEGGGEKEMSNAQVITTLMSSLILPGILILM